MLLKGLTLRLVWSKYLSSILNTSAVTNTFQNLNTKLNMGVNDKVRTDLDLHKWSNSGKGVYVIERSYPKVGVGLHIIVSI